jgi:hypothetical protein
MGDLKDHDGSDTFRLYQAAAAAQIRWAADYVQQHRYRRRYAWLVAVPLAGYLAYGIFCLLGGSWWDAFLIAFCFTLIPLCCIQIATEEATKGYPAAGSWLVAWVMLLLDGGELLWRYHSPGHLAYGITQAFPAVCIPLVLAYGLRIPLDPSVDWARVQDDFLCNVETAGSREVKSPRISDYRQAEEISASWLRRFGYRDAEVSCKSGSGHDDGIDVYSVRAVAQVKYWLTKRVGIREVQRLAGASEPGQAKFFFAASGYTKEAARWAALSDQRVALFIIRPNGHLRAENYYAKKAVWFAKFRVPLELRKPRQRKVWPEVISTFFFGLGTAFFLAVLAQLVTASHIQGGKAEPVAIIMSLTVLFLLMFIHTSAAIIRRLVNATRNYFRYRQWPGWRSIFVDPPKHYHDIGLPSDDFVGFEIPALLRIVALAIDLRSSLRRCHRLVSSWVRRYR